jgi:beta-1,4-mannosyltransferase
MRILMMPDYRADNPYQSLLETALQAGGADVHFPQGYSRIFPIFRAATAKKVEILHLHWLTPYLKGKTFGVALIYAIKFLIDIGLVRCFGIRVVWTIHNSVSHESKFPRLESWVQDWLSRFVDGVIVHHQSAKADFCQTYGLNPAKVTVIPHGHYRDVYPRAIAAAEARKLLNLPQEGLIYLSLGMIRPYKGLENLLNVWRCNSSVQSDQILLIAGKALDPSFGESIAQQATGLSNVVLHAQFIPNQDIHLYFSAADVVVLPFEQILTSGSLILAMSYAKPIIAPRRGGVAEVLGQADGLLYSPDESHGLSQSIQRSRQTDLQELGRLTEAACLHLNWQGIAQKTKHFYQSVQDASSTHYS